MEEISIKKLVSNNNVARFSHAIAGILYYRIDIDNECYQFCIDMNDKEDVGTATFNSEEKAIHLMRYLNKSKKSNELIRVR